MEDLAISSSRCTWRRNLANFGVPYGTAFGHFSIVESISAVNRMNSSDADKQKSFCRQRQQFVASKSTG